MTDRNEQIPQLVCAVASSALFDLTESHQVFAEQGETAYADYQLDNELQILKPGVAFPLVKKLLHLNDGQSEPLVDVILLSRNSAHTGLRVFNSIEHYSLNIKRAAFTRGQDPHRYINAFSAHLFLSTNRKDVRQALTLGCAAATILPNQAHATEHDDIRIAFDGDSVLFSDEAEKIYQSQGLKAFARSEKRLANEPLLDGPFKGFLKALHYIQLKFGDKKPPIRTALVTARCAPAHERVIKTLRAWDIRIDESLFLGGLPKTDFLQAFKPDFFFDDQPTHCHQASQHVPTAHVPHGVINE